MTLSSQPEKERPPSRQQSQEVENGALKNGEEQAKEAGGMGSYFVRHDLVLV